MRYDGEEGMTVVVADDRKGDYMKLRDEAADSADAGDGGGDEPLIGVGEVGSASSSSFGCTSSKGWWWPLWWWAKLLLLLIFLGVLAAVFLKWVGPFFMDKEIIPLLNWERETFSKPVLAILLFASVSLFPALLLPSTPSMWVAGMTFGYGYGFLLIIGGAAIGVSVPFCLSFLFHHKIQRWLERHPKRASIIKLAGEGNWFKQFRAVTLIRISPFPYVIYNYCAFATEVKYFPYLLGSLLGLVPEIFVAIYTGILIKTLADASHDHRSLSAPQIIFNVLGFCFTVTTTVIITVYAKRRLSELQREEELLLQ